jgi:hypothetical protein
MQQAARVQGVPKGNLTESQQLVAMKAVMEKVSSDHRGDGSRLATCS